MSVEDKDRGWNEIVVEVGKLNRTTLEVGIFKPKEAMKALWNEFGTRTAPARSFLRRNFDERQVEYGRLFDTLGRKVLGGELSATLVLNTLGHRMVADVKNLIVKIQDPPNAPYTIAQKGSANPLIDSGDMKNAVDYRFK